MLAGVEAGKAERSITRDSISPKALLAPPPSPLWLRVKNKDCRTTCTDARMFPVTSKTLTNEKPTVKSALCGVPVEDEIFEGRCGYRARLLELAGPQAQDPNVARSYALTLWAPHPALRTERHDKIPVPQSGCRSIKSCTWLQGPGTGAPAPAATIGSLSPRTCTCAAASRGGATLPG